MMPAISYLSLLALKGDAAGMMTTIRTLTVGDGSPLVLLAGPCVVENREITFAVARAVKSAADRHGFPIVFKSSYRKANRSSSRSFTGIGMDEALKILDDVRREFGMPLVTDVHTVEEAVAAAQVVDLLQIPAFLCRQTDLLHAAGRTGKAVNIKKGQFLAPADMKYAAEKVKETGNSNILLTERGTTFGYHNLVVDMRSLPIMRSLGYPVILDATHAVQLPGGEGGGAVSGGESQFIFPIARAGAAVGVDGLFLEVHPDPPRALSDAGSQLRTDLLDKLLSQVSRIDQACRETA
jgi:2-dehydro-3-deoxyphosphooctonate aldolase (KDO 8-P synthase)